MPVELEGYIRPGCTILTVFIAMPKFMWVKLHENPVSYVHDFVVVPGRMLSGRGSIVVYLNNMIFCVMNGGTSVRKVDVKVCAPRLHYVHPICFEAGKPMEFVVCGSNLLQPNFRFLISFAGKYLAYDYCVTSSRGRSKGDSPCSLDHQLYKIHIPQTEPNLFGPAFVEVDNESGLSNFIPVLVGDKEICSEMKIIQQRFDASVFSKGLPSVASGSLSDLCEVSALRQAAFSEFVLDVAWLLKEPASDNFQRIMTSSQIQRFSYLLNFLICNQSTTILEKVLQNLTILIDSMVLNSAVNGTGDADMGLLQKYMNHAREILNKKLAESRELMLRSEYTIPNVNCDSQSCSQGDTLPVVPITNHDLDIRANGELVVMAGSTSNDRSESVPLINGDVVMDVNFTKKWPKTSCSRISFGTVLSSRPTIFVIATAAVCFGICVVLLHPQKVGEFAVSIRRCLLDRL